MVGNCTDSSIIYGVGLNDSNYTVKKAKKVCGKTIVTWECPYYRKWKSMLARCYSKGKGAAYNGVSVYDDWKRFSTFKNWMEKQDWVGKELDKNLLGGGTLYSPDTCCFISKALNNTIAYKRQGSKRHGVYFNERKGKYVAQISNGRKRVHLGYFLDLEEAVQTYEEHKLRIITEMIEKESEYVRTLYRVHKNKTYPRVDLSDLV